jgi:hypothetical protein
VDSHLGKTLVARKQRSVEFGTDFWSKTECGFWSVSRLLYRSIAGVKILEFRHIVLMVVVLRVPAYFRSLICLLKFSYSLGFQLTRNKLFQKRRRSGRPLGFLVGKWIWKMLSIHRSLFEGRKRSVNWSFVVSSPS